MADVFQKGIRWLEDNWEIVIVVIGVFFLLFQLKR